MMFQSTPSGGKATESTGATEHQPSCFNPRLPGGRRPCLSKTTSPGRTVSIHAFRGEGDQQAGKRRIAHPPVSIHAFRGEGDLIINLHRISPSSFNPRLPGGRRPWNCREQPWVCRSFNPRLPGGRRPRKLPQPYRDLAVSIHAFRGEGDRAASSFVWMSSLFQSTPSGGKATKSN